MKLLNKHDRDPGWEKIINVYQPTQEEIIAFNRKENKQKDIDKRIDYLKSEIHSNHNDGYVREGLTKELKRLMESLNNIDSKEDNDIGNNDDETYGASFGMSY